MSDRDRKERGVRALLIRLGMKPYLWRCPKNRHDWRKVYGDEIIANGYRRWTCNNCPRSA